jgi:hypothetical protein
MRQVILAGIMLAPVAAIAWIITRDHVPDLEPEQAALIISSTPEFNHSRSVVKVLSTTQVPADSLPEHDCYAEFILTDDRAGVTLKANAQFRYWTNKWHLREFSYEGRPDIKPFEIKSDPDPREEFSK